MPIPDHCPDCERPMGKGVCYRCLVEPKCQDCGRRPVENHFCPPLWTTIQTGKTLTEEDLKETVGKLPPPVDKGTFRSIFRFGLAQPTENKRHET